MKKLTIAALITLGMAGVTYTAMADDHGKRGGPDGRLEAVDANQDGNLTKDEFAAQRAEKFSGADTNGDNLVSAEEFEAFAAAERERKREARITRRFEKLDTNGDGMVSAEEHASHADARLDRMFERMDADGDGVITEAEREAMKEKMRDRRGKRGFGRRG